MKRLADNKKKNYCVSLMHKKKIKKIQKYCASFNIKCITNNQTF